MTILSSWDQQRRGQGALGSPRSRRLGRTEPEGRRLADPLEHGAALGGPLRVPPREVVRIEHVPARLGAEEGDEVGRPRDGAKPQVRWPTSPGGSTATTSPSRISRRMGSPQSKQGASTRTVAPGNSHVTDVASKPHWANQRDSPRTVTRYWVGWLFSGGNDAM